MNKRGVKILLLVVVFIALLGGYYYVVKHPKQNKQAAEDVITIMNLDSTKIKQINITTQKGGLNIKKNGNSWTSVKSANAILDTKKVDALVKSFSGLHADKLVSSSADDLSQYGLDKPTSTATATLDDGSEKTILVGGLTTSKLMNYVMVKGESKIYTLPKETAGTFQYSTGNIRDLSPITINKDKLTYMKFPAKDGRTIELKQNEDQNNEAMQYGLEGWVVTQPFKTQYYESADKMGNLTVAVGNIKYEQLEESDTADLSKYGLDKPAKEIDVKDDKNLLKLFVGKKKDDGNTYVKTSYSNDVYSISSDVISTFDINPFEIVDRNFCAPNIDNVDSIDIINKNGEKTTMTLSRTEKAGTGKNAEKETVTTYKVGDKTVEEKAFKDFYVKLVGMTIEAENDKTLNDNPEVKTVFHMSKGKDKEITTEYVPYSADYYAIFMNGQSSFLVSRDQVNHMLDGLQSIK